MTLDHIAVAVRSIEAAADRLEKLLGYARRGGKVTNTRQKANVMFLEKPQSLTIKLIEPSEPDSVLWDFVRRGGGLHHCAFKVDDVARVCDELARSGVRVLAAPAPGEAFGGHDIAFAYLGLGLNIELIDTDLRVTAEQMRRGPSDNTVTPE